ncbi:MAG: sorbosone dehydrogenase family protein [Rhodocyclaceae bacterium]|nr:sorbosone dehydrogenase family protein [Rhodocyclaceae bacterium]MBX3666887.1 sorbosone dehydrogenase family protein [Rhodocyclaceae bacterium]
MNIARRLGRATRLCVVLMTYFWAGLTLAAPPIEKLRLPPGFRIELWAEVDNARALTRGAGRTVFVGSFNAGRVVALTYDENYRVRQQYQIARGLARPVGVAFRDGALYVSAIDRILRFDAIEQHLEHPPEAQTVTDKLPSETHHGWKFIAFGPDGKLYVPVGAPCNICEPDADRYALILRMNRDGSGREVVARGVRNSVGFDWHPDSGELWFSDNGRDYLGDDAPPCEINRVARTGSHFGYPYCHGGTIADPEFGKLHACSEFEPPAWNLGAHVAPLGLRFYRGNMFPAPYRKALLVAQHGSWNRSRKAGYSVLALRLEGNKVVAAEPFVEGWLQPGEKVWGRPADLLELPDGSLLISDDTAGAIYRLSFSGPSR